jgi:hypothetical protein
VFFHLRNYLHECKRRREREILYSSVSSDNLKTSLLDRKSFTEEEDATLKNEEIKAKSKI